MPVAKIARAETPPAPAAVPPANGAPDSRLWVLWLLAGLLTALGVAFARTRAYFPDEGFHLLCAKLVSEGRKPYLDFFYQHPPLYPYLAAAWMQLAGQNWRSVHTLSALCTGGATLLTAGFVYRRLPAREWRLAGAAAIVFLAGLHLYTLWFGGIGQAYGLCLLLLAAAFRLTTGSVATASARPAAGAGFCAGAAAAASLLTAPAGAILLAWMARYNRQGRFPRKAAVFAAAAAVPWLLWLWLAAQAPRQALFDVFEFHLFYRQMNFPVRWWHQFTVLSSWVDSPQTLLLVLFAAVGVAFLRRAPEWPAEVRAEFRLCLWLGLVLGAYVALAKPTFHQYFVLLIPWGGILASVGIYAVGSRLWPARPAVIVGLVGLLSLMGLGRSFWLNRGYFRHIWQEVEVLAAEVDRVTPPGGLACTTEAIYFASHQDPPAGFENLQGLQVKVAPDLARRLRLGSAAQMEQMLVEGRCDTVVVMEGHQSISRLALDRRYASRKLLYGTYVLWDKVGL